mmetsp:Transcript_90793/g.228337  ORF Transcript_90793/g.228337 Transcript_90793/m.228337 type:complete len:210 (-) Transcript_90793:2904-3533(-)
MRLTVSSPCFQRLQTWSASLPSLHEAGLCLQGGSSGKRRTPPPRPMLRHPSSRMENRPCRSQRVAGSSSAPPQRHHWHRRRLRGLWPSCHGSCKASGFAHACWQRRLLLDRSSAAGDSHRAALTVLAQNSSAGYLSRLCTAALMPCPQSEAKHWVECLRLCSLWPNVGMVRSTCCARSSLSPATRSMLICRACSRPQPWMRSRLLESLR